MNIELILGNITELPVDVIVNAANMSLLGGGGVDGAIHAKAGNELLEECKLLGGCQVGEAKITKGYKLKAQYIIHTVGPFWEKGQYGEEQLLTSCYRNSLILAEKFCLKTIAFPCISTGAYGYPAQEAAHIAISTVKQFSFQSIEKIIFCCFQEKDKMIYESLLNQL